MNIVQVGCHDGNDHVYEYVFRNSDRINSLFLIDPLSDALDLAKKRYSIFNFVKFYEMAIVEEYANEIEFFYPKNIQEAQTSSINKNHAETFQTEVISKKVAATTLDSFFKNNSLSNIDRLYIDTEGLDCKILQSIDLTKYDIKYIEYEYIHSDGTHFFGPNGIALEKKLESFGYKIYDSPPFNKVAKK